MSDRDDVPDTMLCPTCLSVQAVLGCNRSSFTGQATWAWPVHHNTPGTTSVCPSRAISLTAPPLPKLPTYTEVVQQRDQARGLAVQLEQELAELRRLVLRAVHPDTSGPDWQTVRLQMVSWAEHGHL